MNIEVVLTENDPKLGKRGQVVKVSPGYAANYLFPHHKAKPATQANLKSFEAEQVRQAHNASETLAKARALAEKISQTPLVLEVLTGESDKMYGAVTSHEIQTALEGRGIALEKKSIHLEEPIKKIGEHQVPLKLHPEVAVTLKVSVKKKNG